MLLKNSPISHLYNQFDLPVRFLYSQTPLGNIGSKLFSKKLYESNPEDLHNIFQSAQLTWKNHGLTSHNKHVLEIGPGTNLITTLNFLNSGAKYVDLLDKYPRFKTIKKLKPTSQELSFFSKKISRFTTKSTVLKSSLVKFHKSDLAESNLKSDIIFTKSVLEHIKDPDQFIKSSAKILNKNGFAYHWIDLRDHYNFDKPFLFYKYPEIIWEKLLTKPGRSYTNRHRYHQFISSFKNSGFKIIWQKTESIKMPRNTVLAPKFKNMPTKSLETTILQIIVQKST